MVDDPQTIELAAPPKGIQVVSKYSRANTRSPLAFFLVSLLFVEILGAYIAFWLGRPVAEVKELLLEVLGPTSTLVGTAVGFYFGNDRED
jgi:hypothetical protein